MSDKKIKFKRKVSSGNPISEIGKKLDGGEPFYNSADKHLYVGNNDGEDISGKKHIAQVTVSEDEGVCSVSVGEDTDNKVDFNGDMFKVSEEKISLDLTDIVLDGGCVTEDNT